MKETRLPWASSGGLRGVADRYKAVVPQVTGELGLKGRVSEGASSQPVLFRKIVAGKGMD